jgi:ribosomal protein L37E
MTAPPIPLLNRKGEILRLSHSAASVFKVCPEKYYLQKKWRPPLNASALPFGKAIEHGVDALLEGKTLTDALAEFKRTWTVSPATKWSEAKPIFDSLDVFYYASDFDENVLQDVDKKILSAWGEELLEKEDWKAVYESVKKQISQGATVVNEERRIYHRVMWLCCRRRGIEMIKAFYNEILPQIEDVIAIQKQINLENEEGDSIIGYIDYIVKHKDYDYPIIVDLKTAGKIYEQHDLDTSDQLRLYAAAENIKHIGYMVLLKKIKSEKSCDKCGHVRENYRLTKCAECGKGKYKAQKLKAGAQFLIKEVKEKEMDSVLNDISDIGVAIKNNIKWKNPDSCFMYNKKCDYYDACWGDKTVEQLKGEYENE